MLLSLRIRATACLALLLAACQPSPPTPTSSPIKRPAAPPTEPTTLDEPELERERESPASVATPQRWQLTTLVTGAAPAYDSLIGANGFYELDIDGDAATLRKVGQTGTPHFAASEQWTGTGTLVEASNAEWPSARRRTLEVELVGAAERRVLVFDLWFIADELHGSWAALNQRDDSRVGNSWGLVRGRPQAGDPLELEHGGEAACMVCVRAFWNCDGSSFEEPACNSAASARASCDGRLEQARSSGAELPRGCGDYLS